MITGIGVVCLGTMCLMLLALAVMLVGIGIGAVRHR